MGTKIEWTDETWNPVVGCAHVSAGCDGCYAARDAAGRLSNSPIYAGLASKPTPDALPRFTGEIRLLPERLDKPLHWREPRRVFVNSMSDLFHRDVPEEYVVEVFTTMALARVHTFQVLTKRPERMAALVGAEDGRRLERLTGAAAARRTSREYVESLGWEWPLPNVWLGTSVEGQRYANIRIPHLLATPAAVRFLSVEPLLGPVDLSRWVGGTCPCIASGPRYVNSGNPDHDGSPEECPDCYQGELPRVDWVIVGGESGPRARPMACEWVRSLRDQCVAAGVPFFMKQAGAVLAREWGCAHRAGGRMDEWPEEFRVQEWPDA